LFGYPIEGIQMSDHKKTAFDKSVEMGAEVDADSESDSRVGIPRAIFTRDSKLDLSKLQISSLRLAQGMTAEVTDRKANIGQYVLTNFPAYDEVVLVPLGATDIRVYKPDPKKPAMCSAPTGDFGFGNPGGVCVECPLSHWGERNPDTGKSSPPPCKEGVIVRAYSITHKSLVDFQFLGAERATGGFIQQQALSFGWSGFAIKMSAGKKENARGSWYIPKLEMLDEVPEAEREIVGKWYEIFSVSQSDSKEDAIRQLSTGTP
jgi:hypothetical protein